MLQKHPQLAELVSKSTPYFLQYLRSLLDMGGIYDNEKAGKWKVIKDMTVIGAMRNPAQGTECCKFLTNFQHYFTGVSIES